VCVNPQKEQYLPLALWSNRAGTGARPDTLPDVSGVAVTVYRSVRSVGDD
jgi:hypothetical protein